MEDVNILYVHLAYFKAICYIFVAIWYILWLLGIFSRFGMLKQAKSGKP
jgi:hypothetical protein